MANMSEALHRVSKSAFALPLKPGGYAAGPAPSWQEWTRLWAQWDAVTRQMIPDQELQSRPIKLRNACIFYLGHIPTFFDMKLTEVLDEDLTEPKHYSTIFERGIDPDVDNPEHVHAHSEIPDEWPPVEDILEYQGRVRERVKRFYDSGEVQKRPEIARRMWLGYEHEYMHLETLLYMLIQSDKTQPPPSVPAPDFQAMAKHAELQAVPSQWIEVPEQDITIGMDDPEVVDGPERYFGWDCERPSRREHVHAFSARSRPITNGEYGAYMEQSRKSTIPVAWHEEVCDSSFEKNINRNGVHNGYINGRADDATNGSVSVSAIHDQPTGSFMKGKFVRTVFGLVPLSLALHWPISASYDEVAGCAAYMGGRVPTFEEARSIYHEAEVRKLKTQSAIQHTIPAVNSHLINNGVQETPPYKTYSCRNGATQVDANAPLHPNEHFVDLTGCNVGFQNWHPTPVTGTAELTGLGGMGGLWEWTSTPLFKHPGFEPMPSYPAFTQDFFDGKHNIVLGGSWATAPRLAGRLSFVNWYQRNYPYVWAGARLVRDL